MNAEDIKVGMWVKVVTNEPKVITRDDAVFRWEYRKTKLGFVFKVGSVDADGGCWVVGNDGRWSTFAPEWLEEVPTKEAVMLEL